MFTITTPLSAASLNADSSSSLRGALPAPKLSSTTPRTSSAARNARTLAPVMPGWSRRVAVKDARSQPCVGENEWLAKRGERLADFGAQALVRPERPGARAKDLAPLNINLDPHRRQRRQVRRRERVKLLRARLNRAVAPQQLVVKEQADLRDRVVAREDERTEEVVD